MIGLPLALGLASLMACCVSPRVEAAPPHAAGEHVAAAPASRHPHGGASTMPPEPYRGPAPDFFTPYPVVSLPEGALLLFRMENHFQPSASYRWLLYGDGRLFLQQGAEPEGRLEPGRVFSGEPSACLTGAQVQEVGRRLTDARFFEQAPVQGHLRTEDGASVVVTARLSDARHQVQYYAYWTDLTSYLWELVRPQPAAR